MHASRCMSVYERVFLRAFVFPLTMLKSLTEVPSCWSLRCFLWELIFPVVMPFHPRPDEWITKLSPFSPPHGAYLHASLFALRATTTFFFFPPMICRTTGSLSHWSCVDTKGCWDLVRSVYTSRNEPPSRLRPVCAVLSIRLSIPKLHMFLNL